MASRPVAEGALLTLRIDEAAAFAKRCPAQYAAPVGCAAFVNFGRVKVGQAPILACSWSGRSENRPAAYAAPRSASGSLVTAAARASNSSAAWIGLATWASMPAAR